MTDACLPPDVAGQVVLFIEDARLAARFASFCSEGKAGRVVLDMKDGRAIGGEFVEKFAVRPPRSA